MISTREIAKMAGVSQSTVSRSLNDYPEISVETKEKIRSLAKEHGYVVRSRTSKTVLSPERRAIGLLMTSHPFFTDIFIHQLVSEITRTVEKENYYIIPLVDYRGPQGIQKIRDFLKLGLIEGFVIINREYDQEMDAYFREICIPHVYLLYYSRNSTDQTAVVDSDNYLGGCLAARHLISLGHKTFATLTSPWDEFTDRTNGFKAVLMENGLSLPKENTLVADRSYDAGYTLVKQNIHMFPKVTSIFSQSDIVAIGVINALKDNGFRVPHDVSVVGQDGTELGELIRPQLTSITHPLRDLARITVAKLLEISNKPEKTRTIKTKTFLQPEIVIRHSTAPPPG